MFIFAPPALILASSEPIIVNLAPVTVLEVPIPTLLLVVSTFNTGVVDADGCTWNAVVELEEGLNRTVLFAVSVPVKVVLPFRVVDPVRVTVPVVLPIEVLLVLGEAFIEPMFTRLPEASIL